MSSGCSGVENDQASLVAEISPGLSHQEILCNKEALERRLSLRRARGELVDQGIIPAVSAAPSILSQRARLERAQTGDILQKKIRVRPNRAQLIQRHILQENASSVDPSLIAKQIQLQRKKLEDDLNDRLAFRPGPLELVKDHILEADTAVGLAVQTGQVNYTGTADLLEPISPESQEGSPVTSPVEESQPTPTTGPSQAEIQFQEQQLQLQLQIQQQQQLQQQQQQQQQQHIQSLLQHQQHLQRQQQQHQQQQAPVQLGGGSKKESRRRKTAKAKFKKYKYHEYRPPNGAVQKSELASDSPYGLLLQQQQLYLQLQVLYQHYPNQYPLPAIPENGKLVNSGGKNGNNGEKEKPIKIEDMRVVDMRKELKSRGLPVSGSKTDLIERLKLADAQAQASSPATSAEMVMTASPPAAVTTAATTEMQAQGLVVPQDSHGGLQRSNSMPMQALNVPSLQQQLQIQIMANKQNLQNMNLPPDVQQQLQHLQYLNLQFQLEQLKIQQQQQNIQPKPQQSGQPGTLIKQETHALANCGIKNSQSMPNLSPQQQQAQQQAKKQAPQQGNVGLVISPPKSAPVPMKRPLAQQQAQAVPVFSPQEQVRSSQDSVQLPVNQSQSLPQGQPNSSVSHHQDEVRTLPNEDGGSRKNSQDVLGISWQQQHPLFDGDSPASVDSSVFSQSPLEAKSLDNLDFVDSGKAENRPLHRTCSERSADYQQELLMPTQTKPRSMSEPHFQPGHRRSTSFPTISYSVPPPSYEAHMAAQYQNHVASSDHLQLGYDDSQSMKSEDMEVAMDQCMQDKEIRALQKAMLTSLETDELLGLLGGNNNCPPSENRSHFSLGGMPISYPIPSSTSCVPSQYSNAIPRSPSGSFLHSVATNHHIPSRISKSCDDVSILNHGLKTVSNFEQNHIPDIDSFMGPASPIRADMATDIEEMNSGELFHSSNSIPIPSLNMHKSEPLSWLDLSLSPSHTSGSTSPMNSVPTFTKEALPNSLYDTVSPLRQEEVFSLSLFDLETPTLLHAPTEFPEAMETGFV